MSRSAFLIILSAACAAAIVSCTDPARTNGDGAGADIAADVTARALLEQHNRRVASLDRVWSRSAVRVTWTDEDGRRRDEQGEGHFHFRRPALGVSIGKLGETLFWLGFNDQLYWFADLHEENAFFYGRQSRLTRERAASLGLPALPDEFTVLMGLAPIPEDAQLLFDRVNRTISFSSDATGRSWRIAFDEDRLPARIELLGPSGEPLITSELDRVKDVRVGDERPLMPSRVVMTHVPSDTSLLVSLRGTPTDGYGGGFDRLEDDVFDPVRLSRALGLTDRRVDLDQADAR